MWTRENCPHLLETSRRAVRVRSLHRTPLSSFASEQLRQSLLVPEESCCTDFRILQGSSCSGVYHTCGYSVPGQGPEVPYVFSPAGLSVLRTPIGHDRAGGYPCAWRTRARRGAVVPMSTLACVALGREDLGGTPPPLVVVCECVCPLTSPATLWRTDSWAAPDPEPLLSVEGETSGTSTNVPFSDSNIYVSPPDTPLPTGYPKSHVSTTHFAPGSAPPVVNHLWFRPTGAHVPPQTPSERQEKRPTGPKAAGPTQRSALPGVPLIKETLCVRTATRRLHREPSGKRKVRRSLKDTPVQRR